jgi:purine-binding chemotaxis protein CheW
VAPNATARGRRLDASGRAAIEERAASPERIRQVLEERARALARPPMPVPGDVLEVITFALANETYAIESRFVFEVFRLEQLATLPGATLPVFGVTVRRGELLTILDLRTVLGLPVTALNDLSRVLVLGVNHPTAGVLVDAVLEIVTLPTVSVQAPPDGMATKRDYLRGMTTGAVLVLDGQRLLRLTEPDPTMEGVGE